MGPRPFGRGNDTIFGRHDTDGSGFNGAAAVRPRKSRGGVKVKGEV